VNEPHERGETAGMSTLIVGNFLSATLGSRGVCEDLSRRLRERGWSVVTTSTRPGQASRLLDMLATVWRARKRYSVAQVDVFSGRAFFWAESVCEALRAAGRPFVLTLHGGDLPAFARRWPRRVGRLLRGAAAVTSPSPFLAGEMRPYRSDVMPLPNALDLRRFPFRQRRKVAPRLVWLRSFHRRYDPVLAVKVLAALRPEFPDTRLTMFGADRRDGSLEGTWQTARRLGVADCLETPGPISHVNVAHDLSRGDIFLNTTRMESFGMSVMEAAALGLCVVSTRVGALPSIWTNRENTLLVPSANAPAMAGAVRDLITSPALAAKLSRQARSRAEQCDAQRIVPRWDALLKSVARGTCQ
jgi:glycosyltransferase involved in cell wall biosynthesis